MSAKKDVPNPAGKVGQPVSLHPLSFHDAVAGLALEGAHAKSLILKDRHGGGLQYQLVNTTKTPRRSRICLETSQLGNPFSDPRTENWELRTENCEPKNPELRTEN